MNPKTPKDKQSSMLTRLANSNRHKMQQSYRKYCPTIREELSSDKEISSWLSLAHRRARSRILQGSFLRYPLLMLWVASLRHAHSICCKNTLVEHFLDWSCGGLHHRSVPHWGLPQVSREPLLQPFSDKTLHTSTANREGGAYFAVKVSNPQQKRLH